MEIHPRPADGMDECELELVYAELREEVGDVGQMSVVRAGDDGVHDDSLTEFFEVHDGHEGFAETPGRRVR